MPKPPPKPAFGSIETRTGTRSTTYRAKWRANGRQPGRTFDTYEEALDFLNEMGAEIRRGGEPYDPNKPNTPFRRYAEQWYRSRPGAKCYPLKRLPERPGNRRVYVKGEPLTAEAAEFAASRRRERSAIAHLNHTFGDAAIGSITRHDVQAWVNDNDREARTVRNYYATLRHIMYDAELDGYLPRGAPVGERKVKLPPVTKRMIWLTDEQMDHLLAVALEKFPAGYALVHTAAHTGARESELMALVRTNYNPLRGYIDIVEAAKPGAQTGTTKTRKERRVDLMPCCVRVLNEHLAGHSSLLVFPGANGALLDVNNWRNRVWNPLREAAGFEEMELHFHDLRHSHCAALLAAGWDVGHVADRLGHESPSMTLDVYRKAIPGRQRKLLEEKGIRADGRRAKG